MRIKELQKFQKSRGIALSVIFFDDPSFAFFTGISGIRAMLIVPARGKPFLIVSPLEKSIAKQHSYVKNILAPRNPEKYIPKNKKIGVDKRYVSMRTMEKLRKKRNAKLVDISPFLDELRSIKSKKEINYLKKACDITSRIMKLAVRKASRKMTEIQLRRFIDVEIIKHGVEPSFPAIVASGKNSSNPHHLPSSNRLNGFTVIDIGVRYRNYCSDMTRTIYIGKPSKKEIDDYEMVRNVQEEALKLETKKCSALFLKAWKRLGKDFIHGLGHGVGIEVHESPSIGKGKDILKDNMVFTIEPGIYRKNYGIRIEDTILLRNNKAFILTKMTKKLIIKR